MAFLGGAFIPLAFAPHWIVKVSYFMPLRYLVIGMQNVMARGDGPGLRAAGHGHPARVRRRPHADRGPGVPLGRDMTLSFR